MCPGLAVLALPWLSSSIRLSLQLGHPESASPLPRLQLRLSSPGTKLQSDWRTGGLGNASATSLSLAHLLSNQSSSVGLAWLLHSRMLHLADYWKQSTADAAAALSSLGTLPVCLDCFLSRRAVV